MKLIDPSDDALNEAFAVEVAGWVPTCTASADDDDGRSRTWAARPNYCRSADAVLPWLEKCDWQVSTRRAFEWEGKDGYVRRVELNFISQMTIKAGRHEARVDECSFPRAAAIAAQRAEAFLKTLGLWKA